MQTKIKGSVLVYTLILLFVMLSIAAAISVVSITEKKSARTTEKTTQAFQIADSGIENVMNDLRKNIGGNKDMEDVWGINCNNATGEVTGDIGTGKKYTIKFFKDNGGTVQEINNCNESVDDIVEIKSVGIYDGTVRSVQVAVAAATTGFGAYEDKNMNTVYTADTDGFVVAAVSVPVNAAGGMTGYADNNANPTTVVARSYMPGLDNNDIQNITFPVKKGDKWKVVNESSASKVLLNWISVGN